MRILYARIIGNKAIHPKISYPRLRKVEAGTLRPSGRTPSPRVKVFVDFMSQRLFPKTG